MFALSDPVPAVPTIPGVDHEVRAAWEATTAEIDRLNGSNPRLGLEMADEWFAARVRCRVP